MNYSSQYEISNYYLSNLSHCLLHSSYFASSDYVSSGVHIITAISIPLSLYGFYCVIKVTPKQLIGVKWVLLNFYTWTVVIDMIFNVLSIPFMFFPSISGIMLGWGDYLNIPPLFLLYSIQSLVSVFTSAAIGLLENRQNLLETKWKVHIGWIRIMINIFNYTVAIVVVIPPYLATFDIESMAIDSLKSIVPCPVKEFFDSHLFFLTNRPLFATMLMATQCMIYVPQFMFCTLHTWYHLVYSHSSRVSPETRKMQLRFFFGSFLQIGIPITFFSIPIVYIWFSVNTGYYNQEVNNHIMLIVSLHGILGTGCMILIHNHYRIHFVKLITLGKIDLEKEPSAVASLIRSVVQNVEGRISN